CAMSIIFCYFCFNASCDYTIYFIISQLFSLFPSGDFCVLFHYFLLLILILCVVHPAIQEKTNSHTHDAVCVYGCSDFLSHQARRCRCPSVSIPSNPFCRSASYSTMATEFPRLRDLMWPIMGIRTQVSGWSTRISSGMPALSFPNMI